VITIENFEKMPMPVVLDIIKKKWWFKELNYQLKFGKKIRLGHLNTIALKK
jgi:hypothetical protein